MDAVQGILRKSFLPLLGLLLTAALITQLRGLRGGTAEADTAAVAAPSAAPAAMSAGVAAEGRIVTYPGAEVAVAADAAGVITRLTVEEKDTVRKGQLLAELEADDLRSGLAEQRARVAEADADIRLAEINLARAEKLLAARVGTEEAVDRARRDRDAATARRETATAAVARLQAQLAKTRIEAPIAGTVITRGVHPGEHLEAGDPLVTLADLTRLRIEAEVDEFDAGRMALGAPVTVTAEGWDGRSWQGTVEEIPDNVVGRRLKPQDPGKPSDTRVLLVKIALAEETPLKLGQRVEVEIAPGGGQVAAK